LPGWNGLQIFSRTVPESKVDSKANDEEQCADR